MPGALASRTPGSPTPHVAQAPVEVRTGATALVVVLRLIGTMGCIAGVLVGVAGAMGAGYGAMLAGGGIFFVGFVVFVVGRIAS